MSSFDKPFEDWTIDDLTAGIKEKFLTNGYDYENQAWVEKGKYIRCGHPESMKCRCYGRLHEGEKYSKRDEMRKIYLELTEDQKKRGIIFSSSLSEDRQEGEKIHEVLGDDPQRSAQINRLTEDSFFDNSPFQYNVIRSL